MNDQEFQQLWAELTAGDPSARQQMAAHVEDRDELLEQIVEERQVDAMLQVLAAPQLDPVAIQARGRRGALPEPHQEPIVVEPRLPEPVPPWQRHRWLIGAGLVGLAASLLVVLGWWGNHPTDPPSTAQQATTETPTTSPNSPTRDRVSAPIQGPGEDPGATDTSDTPSDTDRQASTDTDANPMPPMPGGQPSDAGARTPAADVDAATDRPDVPAEPVRPGLPAGLELVRLDGSAWQPAAGETRSPERLVVPSGSGILRDAAGLEITFVGPMEADFESGESIRLLKGHYLVRTPRETSRWQMETPLARLQPRGGSEFQLRVDEQRELEAWVDRGKLLLDRETPAEGELPLELTDGRMPQGVVTAATEPQLPTVLMARGPRLFLGQVLFDQQAAPTHRPEELARMVQAFESGRLAGKAPQQGAWQPLAQRMQRAQRQANGPPVPLESMLGELFDLAEQGLESPSQLPLGNSQSNSAFQGSININGQNQTFDSPEAFENARRQIPLLGNFPDLGTLNQLPNQGAGGVPGGNRQFDGEVNINGRRLRFTSPEQFEAFRRQLNRK